MSRQQNKRTIGSSKSCVDLIFHPPKKNSKKNAQQKRKHKEKQIMIQPEILYEDAQLIICYKPAGIATQTKKLGQKDMVSILLNHVAQEGTGQPFIGVVHRLDQPVEGVMVFAKTKQAAAKLSAQVKDHSFGKKYYAKVRLPEGKTFEQATGHEKTGTLQDWIQFEPKENKSCVIEQKQRENEREDITDPADGKRLQLQKPRHTATSQNKIQEAVLDYQVIRQGEGSALLDITLHTGRHHQIRVQLAHLGTPICGDHKYGKAERGTPALCSYHIDFVHPVSGKEMTYEISPRNFETEC